MKMTVPRKWPLISQKQVTCSRATAILVVSGVGLAPCHDIITHAVEIPYHLLIETKCHLHIGVTISGPGAVCSQGSCVYSNNNAVH